MQTLHLAALAYLILSARFTGYAQQIDSTTMMSVVREATLPGRRETSSDLLKETSSADIPQTTAMSVQPRDYRDWFGYSLMWLSEPPTHVRTKMLAFADLPATMSMWKQVERPEQALGSDGQPQPDNLVDYTLLHKFANVKVTRKHGADIPYSTSYYWDHITAITEFSKEHAKAEISEFIQIEKAASTSQTVATTESYIGSARPSSGAAMLIHTAHSTSDSDQLSAPKTSSHGAVESQQLAVTH